MSVKWTPDEIAFIERHCKTKTYQWMAERIHKVSGNQRTENAITVKAGRLLLGDSIPDGYVRPYWLLGGTKNVSVYLNAVKDAKREGALRIQTNSRKNKYLVKAEWADKWLQRRERGLDGVTPEEIRQHWLTTQQFAKILGHHPHTLATVLTRRGTYLGRIAHEPAIRRWRDLSTPAHRYYWHPDDAKRIAKLYAEHKRTRPRDARKNLLHNHKGSTINE